MATATSRRWLVPLVLEGNIQGDQNKTSDIKWSKETCLLLLLCSQHDSTQAETMTWYWLSSCCICSIVLLYVSFQRDWTHSTALVSLGNLMNESRPHQWDGWGGYPPLAFPSWIIMALGVNPSFPCLASTLPPLSQFLIWAQRGLAIHCPVLLTHIHTHTLSNPLEWGQWTLEKVGHVDPL